MISARLFLETRQLKGKKNIILFGDRLPLVIECSSAPPSIAKRSFIGPPTHAGTILYCSCVGTLGGEVLWRLFVILGI